MNWFGRLVAVFSRAPASPEEIEAAAEAAQLRNQVETTRLSARSSAAENYQSGRGPRP